MKITMAKVAVQAAAQRADQAPRDWSQTGKPTETIPRLWPCDPACIPECARLANAKPGRSLQIRKIRIQSDELEAAFTLSQRSNSTHHFVYNGRAFRGGERPIPGARKFAQRRHSVGGGSHA